MKRAKMIFQSVSRVTLIILILGIYFHRITGTTVALNPRQDHHRVASLSHRDIWPSWFKRRQDTATNFDNTLSIVKENVREHDRYHYRPRHEISSRSRLNVGVTHPIHDNAFEKSRNRDNDVTIVTPTTRKDEKTFYDIHGSVMSVNETTNSRDLRGFALTDFFGSKSTRPTSRTTRKTRKNFSVDGKPEKLTAIAAAEYTGTRTVAYAGHHSHNHDYNSPRTREIFAPGYAIVATTTNPSYTKHHAGRRVCTRPPTSITHHRSRQYGLVYTELSSSTFLCCPGWSQVSRTSYGCNRPTCAFPCLNGGICGPHGKCNCPKAFTGTQCQTDVDECVTEKPCGQLCTNLPGSYECHCRYGFHLQPDGQSCRKNGSDGTAFEARDLENDYGYTSTTTTETTSRRTTPSSHDTENEVENEENLEHDYEMILKRLAKLEKQIARGKRRDNDATEMSTRITQAVESVAAMRRAVDNVQLMQQEIYDMRGKVKQFELESRKLQHLTNRVAELETRLRLRCRNSIKG